MDDDSDTDRPGDSHAGGFTDGVLSIGVDLATEPSATALAAIFWHQGATPALVDVKGKVKHDDLVKILKL